MTTKIQPDMIDDDSVLALIDSNYIINGDMAIDQRQGGASITVTSGPVFCVDRFRAGMSGANGTGQRVASDIADMPFALQLTGAVSTTTAWIGQMIESVNAASLVGKQVTLSFYAASSTVTSLNVAFKSATATDNFTSTTTIETNAQAITSTLTRYSITFDAVAASAANGLYVEFATASNLGSGTLTITGVQLSKGTHAIPFPFRQRQAELALCQRYFYQANALPLGVTLDVSDGYSALVRFPSAMRAIPTLSAGATYSVGSGSAGTPAISGGNGEAVRMNNSAANWTANVTVSVTAGFSAELS